MVICALEPARMRLAFFLVMCRDRLHFPHLTVRMTSSRIDPGGFGPECGNGGEKSQAK
jgi:hypothetical protein